MPRLFDLQFADGILIFARSCHDALLMLDKFFAELEQVGQVLNISKTMVVTTEAQPPRAVTTHRGEQRQVLAPSAGHKWLGCMLSAGASTNADIDLECHLR